jgi:hypothetical protein
MPSYLPERREAGVSFKTDPCSLGRHVEDHFMRASIGAIPPSTKSREVCNSYKKFAVYGKDVVTTAKDQ